MANDIHRFDKPYDWLSNFYPCAGFPAPTLEHMYQAMKFIERAPRIYALILRQPTPGRTKAIAARSKHHISLTWKEDNREIMRSLLHVKFHWAINPGLAEQLVDTGDAFLIEGNTWHDTYWGVCECSKHRGDGANHLGQLLMFRRHELQQEGR